VTAMEALGLSWQSDEVAAGDG